MPHALSSAGGTAFSYDENGNVIAGSDGLVVTWNAENMATSVRRNGTLVTQKSYVGEKQWRRIEGATTTYYLPGMQVEKVGSQSKARTFYGSFAERDTDGTLKFYHGDHLGSSVLVTSSTGAVIHRAAYMPYGGDRAIAGTFTPKRQFTFKEKDASGFYDYGARLYNSATGRWLSPDTSVTDGLNRYAYVSNNPLRYSDPNGHQKKTPQEPAPPSAAVPCIPTAPSTLPAIAPRAKGPAIGAAPAQTPTVTRSELMGVAGHVVNVVDDSNDWYEWATKPSLAEEKVAARQADRLARIAKNRGKSLPAPSFVTKPKVLLFLNLGLSVDRLAHEKTGDDLFIGIAGEAASYVPFFVGDYILQPATEKVLTNFRDYYGKHPEAPTPIETGVKALGRFGPIMF